MKQVIFLALALALSTVTHAQKTAHIDFDALVSSMSETKKLMADMEKLSKTYQEEIKDAETKLRAKAQKYQAEQNSQTVAQNDKRAKELQADELRLTQIAETARKDIASKQQSGYEPIIKKAKDAVAKVAEARGVLYVLPANTLVYAGGEDLLPAVKESMGIK